MIKKCGLPNHCLASYLFFYWTQAWSWENLLFFWDIMFLVIYVKKIIIFNFNMDNVDKTSCVKNVKSHQRVLNFRSQSWPFVAANGIFKLSKSGVLHFHDKMQILWIDTHHIPGQTTKGKIIWRKAILICLTTKSEDHFVLDWKQWSFLSHMKLVQEKDRSCVALVWSVSWARYHFPPATISISRLSLGGVGEDTKPNGSFCTSTLQPRYALFSSYYTLSL